MTEVAGDFNLDYINEKRQQLIKELKKKKKYPYKYFFSIFEK
jgi:hypothetical protein